MPWLHFLDRLLGSFAWTVPEAAGFYCLEPAADPAQLIDSGPEPGGPPRTGEGRARTRRRRRARDGASGPAALADECEAYLTGRFRGYLEQHHQPVPGWAWINPVAHGDPDVVRQLARLEDRSGGPQAAVTDLAQQVVRLVDQGQETLPDLQRRVLIPLEAALLDARPSAVPVDATQLRRAIKHALGTGLLP